MDPRNLLRRVLKQGKYSHAKLHDNTNPKQDIMTTGLCNCCQRIFYNEAYGDKLKHHENVFDLIRASEAGCKLCCLAWSKLDTDEKVATIGACNPASNDSDLRPITCQIYWTNEEESKWLSVHNMTACRTVTCFFEFATPIGGVLSRRVVFLPFRKGLVDYFKNEWNHDLLASDTKNVPLCPTIIASEANTGTPSFTGRNTSTGSNESLAQAAGWITKCVQQHMECKSVVDTSPKIFPARFVYISPCEDGPLRLCETSVLVPDTPYMTLSHCWGSKSFLKLTSENIGQLKVHIPFEALTKTFQDAITITRFNKIEYIWIDSLCIIQDSRQDWEKESSLMKDIYSNSFCNIAASHATDGEMGCFVDRTLSGGSVMIDIPPTFQADNGFHPGIWECRETESWIHEVLNSPLQERAWVFQEYLLPPRTLYFTSKQIHFTCDQIQVCELYPRTWSLFKRRRREPVRAILRSLMIRGSENNVDFPRARTAISLWNDMLNIYTRCDLTRESDRLIAISGLARLLQPLIPGRYLDGHWEDNLIEQLLWKSRGEGSRSGTYLAPSWSWGSTTRPIWAPQSWQTNDIRRTLLYSEENKNRVKTQLAFIRDVEIITTNGDPMSQVTSGFLRMEGALNLIILDGEHSNPTSAEKLLISEDVWREKLMGKYYFVPLIESGWRDLDYRYISSKGLLLRPTGKEIGQYERVAFAYHSGKEGNIFLADRNRQKGELLTEDLYEKYNEETGLYTFTII